MKAKKILPLGTLLTTLIPFVNIACLESTNISLTKKHNYDVGFAIPDMASLNYIKFKSSIPFGRSVVETFKKNAPQYLSMLASYMAKIPRLYAKFGKDFINSPMNQYSYTSGVFKTYPFPNKSTQYPGWEAFSTVDNFFLLRLNGKSKWSNGDFVTPSDFIDAFVYVLDLNTGSQLINDFLELNIANANEFLGAQTAYSKKYKQLYKNPFGYIKNRSYDKKNKHSVYYVQRKDAFPLQIYNKTSSELANMTNDDRKSYLQNQKEEQKLIDKIAFFAKNLGVYGDLNSSHPYTHVEGIQKEEIKNPNTQQNRYRFFDNIFYESTSGEIVYPYLLQIKTNISFNAFQFLVNKLARSSWLPINRKFVEAIGGIEKFGIDETKFLTQGPFTISKLVLGQGGSVEINRNLDYWDNQNTIPNKVKIYFQTDPVITFSMFDDGYISQAKIDAIAARSLYADPKYRALIKKIFGWGTAGFTFNTDRQSPGYNPIIGSQNLRKAIFYAVNRSDAIKLSGFDSTLPHYAILDAWVALGSHWRALTPGGASSLQLLGKSKYYDKYKPNEPKNMFPYKMDSYKQNHIFIGNFDKTDRFQNLELARKYFAAFLKEHPLQGAKKQHTIVYSYDSTKSALQIGVALQTAIKKAFGTRLVLKIKGYPKSVYDTYYETGNFQLSFLNMDFIPASDSSSGGLGVFFMPDGILKKEQKNTGFLRNPTGGWTFAKIVKNKASELDQVQSEIKNRLQISDLIWDKIYELERVPDHLYKKSFEDQQIFLKRRINAFFGTSQFTFGGTIYNVDSNFATLYKVRELVNAANKLVMEASPVIPLFVVDNTISISRLVNFEVSTIYSLAYDYAYDYKFPPLKSLPGYEAMES